MDNYTILMLHVLATQDMGTGMTDAEIARAIKQLTEEQRQEIIAAAANVDTDLT